MKKYDNYKDSGVEWIGEIPSHWVIKKGKYLFKIVSGYSPENVEEQIRKFGIPYFKVNDLNDKSEVFNLEKSNLYVADDILNTSPKETILFPKRGAAISTNKVKISTSDCIFDTNIMGLIPFKEKIHCRYLAYSISNRGLWDIADTSTIPQINNKHIEPLEFVLPETIEEQIQIANFLDHKTSQIDHLIAKKEQFIKLLEEERVAVINQAVTKGLDPNVPMKDSAVEWLGEIPEHWEVKRLGFVFKSLNTKRIPLSAEERGLMTDRVYDYYGASGVIDKVQDYIFDEDLILIGEDGANLLTRSKRLAFIASGKYWVNNHAHIIKPINGDINYYCEFLELIDYTVYISGSAQPKLTQEALMSIKIVEPPLKEQQDIYDFIRLQTNNLDSIISKSKQEIELLKEYKTALISEVVTGKVDVSTSSTQV